MSLFLKAGVIFTSSKSFHFKHVFFAYASAKVINYSGLFTNKSFAASSWWSSGLGYNSKFGKNKSTMSINFDFGFQSPFNSAVHTEPDAK